MNAESISKISVADLSIRVTRNERRAVQWLRFNRLLYSDLICENCGTEMNETVANKNKDGRLWRCPRKGCQKRVSIRKDSFFEQSQLRMGMIIRLIFYWAWQFSIKFSVTDLKVSEKTVIDWFNFCRDVCIHRVMENVQQIGGIGEIVEIDESKFVKAKYNRGRNVGMRDGWYEVRGFVFWKKCLLETHKPSYLLYKNGLLPVPSS